MKKLLAIAALLLVAILAPRPANAQTFVQANVAECSGSSISACTVTFDSPIGAGHFIIGGCNPYWGTGHGPGQSFSSVTDSAGSAYIPGTIVDDNLSNGALSLQPAWTFATGSGGGSTVTFNYSPAWNPGGGGYLMCGAEEDSTPPNALDVVAVGNSTVFGNVNSKTAALTTNHTNEWLVGMVVTFNGAASCEGAGDGQSGTFTRRARNSFFMIMDIAEATAASYSANTTSCSAGTNIPWAAYLLAFYTSTPSGGKSGVFVSVP